MGLVFSLINNAISIAGNVQASKDQAAAEARNKEFQDSTQLVEPPDFYKTIDERNTNITDPTETYSTKSIREALASDTIPTGYALDQLSDVGFKTEVDDFNNRLEKRRTDLGKSLADEVKAIVDEMEKNINDRSSPKLILDSDKYLAAGGAQIIEDGKGLIKDLEEKKADVRTVTQYLQRVQAGLNIVDAKIKEEDRANDTVKQVGERQDMQDEAARRVLTNVIMRHNNSRIQRRAAQFGINSSI